MPRQQDLSPRGALGSCQAVSGAKCYSISANQEWAAVVLRDFPSREDSAGRAVYGGEIMIHSSFGAWAYSWGHCGQPFREFLLDLGFDYVFTKFMGTRLEVFDGEASVNALREKVLEARRAGDLNSEDAREIWDEIGADEARLSEGPNGFVDGAYELPHPARDLFAEPWEFISRKYDEQAVGFWRDIWPTFTAHLRQELELSERAEK